MKVLGISPLDKDATASLVDDGQVIFAAGEERYSRVKQQDGFPEKSIMDALTYTGTKLDDIDLIVYPFLKAEDEMKLIRGNLAAEKLFLDSFDVPNIRERIDKALLAVPERETEIHGLSNPNEKMQKSVLHSLFYTGAARVNFLSRVVAGWGSARWAKDAQNSFVKWEHELAAGLKRIGYSGKVKRYEHHLTHAANSYYASGFAEALCITLDGYGTGLAGSVSVGRAGKINRVHGVDYPNSLGTMYEHVTSSLGFRPSRHEGKIVGLASYGDPELLAGILLSRIRQAEGDFQISGSNNIFFSRYLASLFPKIDVAAAYQKVLEVVATNFVRHWVNSTGISNVVLSGGVAANVKLNQRIFELESVDKIFVYPNMGDGGCGTGAAMYASLSGTVRNRIQDVYLGPDYSDSEMSQVLEKNGLKCERPQDLATTVASIVNKGQVVARFDGRMEYGPRALGNRSILYHAREPEVNQWLNKRLGRTEFMPFAPVTLYEARNRYYKGVDGAEHTAEFMTITFDCTEEMKRDCPAAVHVDGTARPQLIRRECNPGYYDIVAAYEKISGIPCLINTSFNMHEEPIVRNPEDAVRAFLDGRIDYLILGPFLVRHPENERR